MNANQMSEFLLSGIQSPNRISDAELSIMISGVKSAQARTTGFIDSPQQREFSDWLLSGTESPNRISDHDLQRMIEQMRAQRRGKI